MAEIRKRGKNWFYRYIDHDGRRVERKGCPDRRVTEQMAAAAEAESARIRAGLSDPKAGRIAAAGRRPIGDHLAEFIGTMEAAGRNPQHINQTRTYINRILALAGAERIDDLTGSAVMQAVGSLRGDGFSVRSLNAHLTAVKTFSRWLWRDGRARENALAHLGLFNAETDRRRRRRALSPEEAARLVQAAETGPVVRRMTGPDRAMLYRVVLGTGFRRDELRSLTPESFRLADDPPTIVCEAAYTKNGRTAEQPVSEALAARLRSWIAALPPGRPVFRLPARAAEVLRVDLAAAGIPYSTPEGVADLHSLRASYITHLVNGGASVKTCQTLARHSTPTLTIGVYAKTSLHDIAGAVDALPDLRPSDPGPEAMSATGTDGKHIGNRIAPHLPHGGDGNGREGADAGGFVDGPPAAVAGPQLLKLSGVDGSCRGESVRVADGIRTRDPQIHNLGRGRSKSLKDQDFGPLGGRPAPHLPHDTRPTDPDLALVIDRWEGLPEAVRAGIVAMVKAAAGKGGGR